jgi:hypothetical protein
MFGSSWKIMALEKFLVMCFLALCEFRRMALADHVCICNDVMCYDSVGILGALNRSSNGISISCIA